MFVSIERVHFSTCPLQVLSFSCHCPCCMWWTLVGGRMDLYLYMYQHTWPYLILNIGSHLWIYWMFLLICAVTDHWSLPLQVWTPRCLRWSDLVTGPQQFAPILQSSNATSSFVVYTKLYHYLLLRSIYWDLLHISLVQSVIIQCKFIYQPLGHCIFTMPSHPPLSQLLG